MDCVYHVFVPCVRVRVTVPIPPPSLLNIWWGWLWPRGDGPVDRQDARIV